jgi:hypothetical protein
VPRASQYEILSNADRLLQAWTARDQEEYAAAYNTAQRKKLAGEGKALSDGSYPIGNALDLKNAAILAASGHGDVGAAKALIRKRAKELGVDVRTLPGFGAEKTGS